METRARSNDAPERWRDIPGFGGLYQASTEGRIRKVWSKNGKREKTILKMYTRAGKKKQANREALRVHITAPDGRRVERTVIQLVAETFFKVPEGKRAVHRNGLRTDNSVRNIIFLSDRELGERFGAMASRRTVAKINTAGEAVAFYPSARAAAKENFVSYQTVIDRCNRKVKKEFALDGYSYRWDDWNGVFS